MRFDRDQIYKLYYLEDKTLKQVAEVVGTSATTLRHFILSQPGFPKKSEYRRQLEVEAESKRRKQKIKDELEREEREYEALIAKKRKELSEGKIIPSQGTGLQRPTIEKIKRVNKMLRYDPIRVVALKISSNANLLIEFMLKHNLHLYLFDKIEDVGDDVLSLIAQYRADGKYLDDLVEDTGYNAHWILKIIRIRGNEVHGHYLRHRGIDKAPDGRYQWLYNTLSGGTLQMKWKDIEYAVGNIFLPIRCPIMNTLIDYDNPIQDENTPVIDRKNSKEYKNPNDWFNLWIISKAGQQLRRDNPYHDIYDLRREFSRKASFSGSCSTNSGGQ